jgi:Ca2+-binding RTX toxin-like protein
MLEVFGLVAALFAGFLAETFLSGSETEDSTPPVSDDEPTLRTDFVLGDGGAYSTDQPMSSDPDQTLTGGDQGDILASNGGNDQIWGGAGDDALSSRAGEDSISAGDGDDQAYGGDGNDFLMAGDGNDTVYGEAGNDVLNGEGHDDMIYAGSGDDDGTGGAGNDQIFGGEGSDTVSGGAGNDAIDGGLGTDLMAGGVGEDELFGGAGDDTIWGQSAGAQDNDADFLNGGDGNDLLILSQGDTGNGGVGSDTFAVTDFGANAQIVDFDPSQDQLLIQYDPKQITDPVVTVQSNDAGETLVMLNGNLVASLTNGAALDAGQISLRALT